MIEIKNKLYAKGDPILIPSLPEKELLGREELLGQCCIMSMKI